MAKRQAEKQLTDRNWQDEENDDNQYNGPMKLAAPQVIQTRPIRSLPKKVSTATQPTSNAPSNPSSLFKASQPFGPSTVNGSSSSSTLANSSKPPLGANGSSTSLFGSSFNAGENTPNFSSPKVPASTASLFGKSFKPSPDATTLYYSSLRGLNLSVTATLEQQIKKDAFVDLSNMLERVSKNYEAIRTSLEEKLKESQMDRSSIFTGTSQPPSQPASSPMPALVSLTAESESSSQAEATKVHLNPSPKQTSSNKEDSARSAPSFLQPTIKAGTRPGAFPTATPARPSPLRFETQSTPESTLITKDIDKNNEPSSESGSAVPSFPTTGCALVSSSVSASSKVPCDSSAPKSLFGTSGNSLFGTKSGPTQLSTTAFSFTPTAATSGSTAPSKPGFGFGFGISSTPGNAIGAFGMPKNATEVTPPKNGFNPVGFSFGNSPTSTSTATFASNPAVFDSSATKGDPIPKSSFGSAVSSVGFPQEQASGEPTTVTTKETKEATQPPAPDTGASESGSSSILDTKQGEEEEDTIFETTGRIYALLDKLQEDGTKKKQWVGWAVCSVRLNQHKISRKSRILARNQTNKNIIVNFHVRSDLNPVLRGTAVEFLGFDGSKPQAYRIRPSSVENCEQFIQAIKEVVAAMSKS